MSADDYVTLLTFLTMPPALLYPLVYGLTAPWWRSWIGRALFIKAFGLALLLSYASLFYLFGMNYWGREYFRVIGFTILCPGLWLAFFAMLNIKFGLFAKRRQQRLNHERQPQSDDLGGFS